MPWFVKDSFTDVVSGPFDDAQLKSLATRFKIDSATEVAKGKDGPWHAAGRVSGLFPATADADAASVDSTATASVDTQQRPPEPIPRFGAVHGVDRNHTAPDSSSRSIQAKDGLFFVVWKLVRGTREYSFHDDDFPALAACLRIGATLSRVWFCVVFLILIVIALAVAFDKQPQALAAWCSITGDDLQEYLIQESNGLEVHFTPYAFLWGIVRHFIKFLAIMGGMEFVRVFLAIEKNTRRMPT